MRIFEKPCMIRYECMTEGYIMYFENQDVAAKRLGMSVQNMNLTMHYKKGVINFAVDPNEPEDSRMKFINDTLTRVWVKPEKAKFDTYIDLDEHNKMVKSSGKVI